MNLIEVYEEPTWRGWLVYTEDGRELRKGTKVVLKGTRERVIIKEHIRECSSKEYALHSVGEFEYART